MSAAHRCRMGGKRSTHIHDVKSLVPAAKGGRTSAQPENVTTALSHTRYRVTIITAITGWAIVVIHTNSVPKYKNLLCINIILEGAYISVQGGNNQNRRWSQNPFLFLYMC